MKLVCASNCDVRRCEIIGFRLVGAPITLKDDLSVDPDQVYRAVINIHRGLIPGAKILCGGCHQEAMIEE
jgi:hypothetical protein